MFQTLGESVTSGIFAKRGPKTPLSDQELSDQIRRLLAASPFHGEGYRKVWARLRHAGVRASKPRVLRLMRRAKPAGPAARRPPARPAGP